MPTKQYYNKNSPGRIRTSQRWYKAWASMKARCYSPNACGGLAKIHYQDKGVVVCERWMNSPENFLSDMGHPPEGMSLDRWPNPEGNYEPENCRWATDKQQSQNRRTVKLSEGAAKFIRGMRWISTQAQIARVFGVNPSQISRVLSGRRW